MFFTPVTVAPDPQITQAASAPSQAAKRGRRGGRIEIELGDGRRITVGPDADPAAGARLADAPDPR